MNDHKKDLVLSGKLKSQLPELKQYSHEELLQMSNIYFKSKLLPEHLTTPESAYIAMRWCLGLGIDPFLGLRDIFVIDGIPSVRTEAAIAMVEVSGFSENIKQYFEGNPFDDTYTAVCVVKRKGRDEHVSKFSVKDAKTAGLWGKKTKNGNPTSWVSYPHRMLMYRAVGFALRDIYPDVLRGARLYEEVKDYTQFETIKEETNSVGEVTKVEVKKAPENKTSGDKIKNTLKDLPPDEEVDFEEVK